jgi:hypothetical protein
MTAAKQKQSSKPYVSNYPDLQAFLDRANARCNWQLRLGGTEDEPTGYVEQWMFAGGKVAVIVIHANGNGWDIFTSADRPEIAATLEDAAVRLGVAPKDRP